MKRSRHIKADLLKPSYPRIRGGDPAFQPAYTPWRMMQLGVFGGNYFANARGKDFGQLNVRTEHYARLNADPTFDPRKNCFGVKAGLTFQEWDKRGWIHKGDPLGWFHWYCRYYAGRRGVDDTRQIGRWVSYKQRWGDRLASQFAAGKPSPVVMQGLLQWSIDPYLGRD